AELLLIFRLNNTAFDFFQPVVLHDLEHFFQLPVIPVLGQSTHSVNLAVL
ncbi:MAG: hypothetical protein ACD_29C00106G0001, partial [uncultured bacterium]